MRNIIQKKYSFPVIFITFGVFFSFMLLLSIPSLYDLSKFEKKIKENIESDFNFILKDLEGIEYRFIPSPHLVINNSNLFLSKNIDNKISSLDKIKINISLFDFYKNKITIKKIFIKNANFKISKKNLDLIIDHLNKKKVTNLSILNSKIFYTTKSKETAVISPIIKLKYFTNIKSNQKNLNIQGNIFDTNYNFKWKKILDGKDETDFTLKFKNPNIFFQNNLQNISSPQKKGELNSTFLNHKIVLQYIYNDNYIELSTKNVPNSFFSLNGVIKLKPFHFNLNTNLKDQKINDLIHLFLNYYYKNKGKLHPNLSGDLNFNLDDIQNAYFNSGDLKFKFQNSDINLNENSINIRNIGRISSIDHFFYNNSQDIIFATNLEVDIENQEEFYRRFLIPKKNRVNLKKIYLIFEKDLNKDFYSISNLSINKKINFLFNEMNLVTTEKIYFDNFQKFRKIVTDEFKKLN